MLKQYTALSVVAPNAGRIMQGQKTFEVRLWHPEALPLKRCSDCRESKLSVAGW